MQPDEPSHGLTTVHHEKKHEKHERDFNDIGQCSWSVKAPHQSEILTLLPKRATVSSPVVP